MLFLKTRKTECFVTLLHLKIAFRVCQLVAEISALLYLTVLLFKYKLTANLKRL